MSVTSFPRIDVAMLLASFEITVERTFEISMGTIVFTDVSIMAGSVSEKMRSTVCASFSIVLCDRIPEVAGVVDTTGDFSDFDSFVASILSVDAFSYSSIFLSNTLLEIDSIIVFSFDDSFVFDTVVFSVGVTMIGLEGGASGG